MENKKSYTLLQKLGLFTAVTFTIGSMIGSGIFKKSATMSFELGASGLLIAVWVIAGLVNFTVPA
jgi:APA family basic amino acid/polyamine antiporter